MTTMEFERCNREKAMAIADTGLNKFDDEAFFPLLIGIVYLNEDNFTNAHHHLLQAQQLAQNSSSFKGEAILETIDLALKTLSAIETNNLEVYYKIANEIPVFKKTAYYNSICNYSVSLYGAPIVI